MGPKLPLYDTYINQLLKYMEEIFIDIERKRTKMKGAGKHSASHYRASHNPVSNAI
jgi:hypothetical protein